MPKHDNDNQARKTTAAIPLAIRLARAGRTDDLARLVRYGTVVTVPTWLSAEDGMPEAGKPQADRVVEIRPSPDEMVTVAARNAIAARIGVGPITPAELAAASERNIRRDGVVISEWRGSDGRWRPTAELFRQPKGSRRKSEQERHDDNARHLSIRGSGGFPERSGYVECNSHGEDYRRQRAAHWVQAMGAANENRRADIDRAGVGTGIDFDTAWANAGLYPACRIPRYVTVIAKGAEFLAYRVHSNPRAKQGGVEGGHDLVERQVVETIDAPRIDAALGEHARVLNLSLAGLTAREIAAANGWGSTKHAERKAVAAQDAALQALADVEKMAA
ncbi:hypothetical protein OCA5_c18810 [Afipia carboxidovorans OM5]|uniref:Uncharacterized protein n=1 Tax=Afipia carboxidovorans (strain ATCC 49405 / DSM 1227 / KCTC 32145 / OM5) TaxID=504832 RepID=F8BUE1_AFIC5|nr:hypothetical protein [Afipia carboxidovorans]AEI03017.1 hypothetical protein OCA4_c18800 [Afipia carboxidovorans OM4]AEI06594.1 hypothetical protein OCA5_c18810 [Afipia carboxidovorans OM5]